MPPYSFPCTNNFHLNLEKTLGFLGAVVALHPIWLGLWAGKIGTALALENIALSSQNTEE